MNANREVDGALAIDGTVTYLPEIDAEDVSVPGDGEAGDVVVEGDPFDLSDKRPCDHPDLVRKLLLDGLTLNDVADRFDVARSEIGRVSRGDSTTYEDASIPPLRYNNSEQEYQPVEEVEADDQDETADGSEDAPAADETDQDAETPVSDRLQALADEVRQVEKATTGDVEVEFETDGGAQVRVVYGGRGETDE